MICITSCMPDLCFRIAPQQQPTRIPWQSKSTLHVGRQSIKHQLGQRAQIIRKSQCYTYPVRILSKVSYNLDFFILSFSCEGQAGPHECSSISQSQENPMERGSSCFNHLFNKYLVFEDYDTHTVICGGHFALTRQT